MQHANNGESPINRPSENFELNLNYLAPVTESTIDTNELNQYPQTSQFMSDIKNTSHQSTNTDWSHKNEWQSKNHVESNWHTNSIEDSYCHICENDDEIIFTENKIYIDPMRSVSFSDSGFNSNMSAKSVHDESSYSINLKEYEVVCQPETDINEFSRNAVFKRVHYQQDKRYYRSSPTNSSMQSNCRCEHSDDDNVNQYWSHNRDDCSIDNPFKYVRQDEYFEFSEHSGSRKTSMSTTESWLDDEIFDNSFNEELEFRCKKIYADYRE